MKTVKANEYNDPVSSEIYGRRNIRVYEDGRLGKATDNLIEECRLIIKSAGQAVETLSCSPEYWEELTIGYFASRGIFISNRDIISLVIERERRTATIDVEMPASDLREALSHTIDPEVLKKKRGYCENTFPFYPKSTDLSQEQVFFLMEELERRSRLYHLTHGCHIALLAKGREIQAVRNDISRRNAMEKLWGYVINTGIKTNSSIILTSGRLAEDMVFRAIGMGAIALISVSTPTLQGVEIARRADLILIGSVVDRKMKIYSGEARIR